MQIDFDGLGEREPALAILMIAACNKDVEAPYSLMMLALDRCEQRAHYFDETAPLVNRESFIRELYELAAEYVRE